MTKPRVDTRVRRALDAFFETEPERSGFEQLTYTGETGVRAMKFTELCENADKWLSVVRSLSLFLPGVFLLYFVTLATAEFYSELDLASGSGLLFWFFAGGFLIYAGVGNLKQVRNLAVPATVVAMALAVVLIAQLLPGHRSTMYFGYSIYIFPVVLVAAKLVQGAIADS